MRRESRDPAQGLERDGGRQPDRRAASGWPERPCSWNGSATEYAIHDAGLDICVAEHDPHCRAGACARVFDMMPTEHAGDSGRRSPPGCPGCPPALDGVRGLAAGGGRGGQGFRAASRSPRSPNRADYWAGMSGRTGYYRAARLPVPTAAEGVSDSLKEEAARTAARQAQEAYAELGGFLRAELAPRAPAKDAVGEEDYRLWRRGIPRRRRGPAGGVRLGLGGDRPAASRDGAGQRTDPARCRPWRRPWRSWTRTRPGASKGRKLPGLDAGPPAERTCRQLHGTHFDIPEPASRMEAMIAPPGVT